MFGYKREVQKLDCTESPEQIEDESKASKTSVSACAQGGEAGR
jgi:hypothetical protein